MQTLLFFAGISGMAAQKGRQTGCGYGSMSFNTSEAVAWSRVSSWRL